MPKVPYSDNVVPLPQADGPSQTEFAMAAAMMHQEGRLFESVNPTDPGHKAMKKYIEGSRNYEDNPDITKYPSRMIEPGEQAIDRERGLDSSRDVRRI